MTVTQKKLQRTLEKATEVLRKKKLITPDGNGNPEVEALVLMYTKLIKDILEVDL